MANRLSDAVVNIAKLIGSASGAFIKARETMLKKPDFVAGLSQQSQWTGGSLINLEQSQMRAARNSWVYVGINKKALDLAAAKLDIYLNASGLEDEGEKAEGHPFLKVLRRPNPYMGKALLMQYTQWWLDLQGEAFWFIEPETAGKGVKGIWPLPSNSMDIEFTEDGKHIKCYILKLQQWYRIDPKYIIHFKYPNPWDFFRGMPPLIAFMLTVDADLAMKMYNGAFFGKDNVMPSAVISLGSGNPEYLFDQKDVEAVTNELKNEYSAIRRKTIVTNANSMAVAMLGYSAKDMDFLAGMQWNRDEILLALNVPPGMVDKNSTEANAKVGNKTFKDDMWGIKCLIADEITSQCLQVFYNENLEARFKDDRVYDRDMELKEAIIAKEAMPRDMWALKYFNIQLKSGDKTMAEEAAERNAEQKMQRSGVAGKQDAGVKKGTSNTIPTKDKMKKHFGPDNHPSGSSQDVHGNNEDFESVAEKYRETSFLYELKKINPSQTREFTFTKAGKNPSKTKGPITVVINEKNQLEILDGNHRYYEAIDRGEEYIEVKFSRSKIQVSDEAIENFVNKNKINNNTNISKKTINEDSLKDDFNAIFKKAKKFFKENRIQRMGFESKWIQEDTLKAILSDLQGVEQRSDIDDIEAHWKSLLFNIEGYTKANTFRLWSEFEQPLATAVFDAFQKILDYLIGNVNIIESQSIWEVIDNILADAMRPIFANIASKAVDDNSKIAEFIISYDLTNQRAREIALLQVLESVVAINDTTKRAIQSAVADWKAKGNENGVQGLIDRVKFLKDRNGNPIFDMARAERIAQSEATEVYAIATEEALVANGYPKALYKPKAHVGCRCYIQPASKGNEKYIVWYTVRDEMVCKQELDTPWGIVQGCRELHRTVVSEGHAGKKWEGNIWNMEQKSLYLKGGAGSGHHGHSGRPGLVGGSSKRENSYQSGNGTVSWEFDKENTLKETEEFLKKAWNKIPLSERKKSAVKRIVTFDNPEDVYREAERIGIDLSEVEPDEQIHGFYDFKTNTIYASVWDSRLGKNSPNTFYHEFAHSVVGRDENSVIAYLENWNLLEN